LRCFGFRPAAPWPIQTSVSRLARYRSSTQALRSLRLQVLLALGLAAVAHVASRSSGDEIEGAYHDSAQMLLGAAGAPWQEVNPEATRLCRELRAEASRIVPIGARRST
jgi:hypothetical protein